MIIAAKNAENTIRIAVKSALASLRSTDEVLVMDDNSSDRTRKLLQAIQDSRLKVFTSDSTLGRSEARNRLIQNSKGGIIAILDADDVSLPWRFELGRKSLRDHEAVFSTALIFGSAMNLLPFLPQIPRAIPSSRFALELLGRNPIVHSTAMYLKSAIPGPVAYRQSEAEEYDLWLRMSNAGCRMRRFRLPWVLYRIHEGQASRAAGFNERGENCPYVQSEQIELSAKLGLDHLSIANAKAEARKRVHSSSFLAKLEIQGLPQRMKHLLRMR